MARYEPSPKRARSACASSRALSLQLKRWCASSRPLTVASCPDLARKLPGRGVWVSCERAHVATAVKTKAFARSLKRPVTVPADLADSVEALLLRRALAALSMANKAGLVLAGFAKIDAAIAAGEVRALLHAAEAAADGMPSSIASSRPLPRPGASRRCTSIPFQGTN